MVLIKEKDKNKHMIKMKRNKRGFTLGEMVTTVAIIGTITAISVPNYMRVRMQVNMEMVKQHLKTIGTHMNDVYNRNKQFPQNINQLGNSGEEVAITASLFGINRREYTTDGYTTGPNLSTFQLRTCPQAGRWGIAGDRCFVLTPLGISEDAVGLGALNPWDGSNIPMIGNNRISAGGLITSLMSDWRLTESQKTDILIDLFAELVHTAVYYSAQIPAKGPLPDYTTNLPSSYMSLMKGEFAKLDSYLPKIDAALRAQGIQFYINRSANDYGADRSKSSFSKYTNSYEYSLQSPSSKPAKQKQQAALTTDVIEVGGKVDNPMTELSGLGNKVTAYKGTLLQKK